MMRHLPRRTRGSTLVAVFTLLLICASIGAAVIVIEQSSMRNMDTRLMSERAFQLAESGLEWALADIREHYGALPASPVNTMQPHPTGEFTVRTEAAGSNGSDDDGDGSVDETDEQEFTLIRSTGRAAGERRTLEMMIRQEVDIPAFTSALAMNSEFPVLTLDGNAFRIKGDDHRINGTPNPSGASQPGISTAGDATYIVDQVAANQTDQITGSGGEPSVEHVDLVDVDRIMSLAEVTADVTLAPGTYSSLDIGTPTPDGIKTVYCSGDLTISGGTQGAGLLAVDGDLHVSGGLEWVGIVLVRGRVNFTGGGANNKIIGSMVIGSDVDLAGTVDLLYSSDAIALGRLRLLYLGVTSWREVANP